MATYGNTKFIFRELFDVEVVQYKGSKTEQHGFQDKRLV